MNEKFSKLADQCRTLHRDGYGGYVEQFDEEKFAELIIEECAEICRKQSLHYAEHNNQGSASSAADVCRILIKSHFGVEE